MRGGISGDITAGQENWQMLPVELSIDASSITTTSHSIIWPEQPTETSGVKCGQVQSSRWIKYPSDSITPRAASQNWDLLV